MACSADHSRESAVVTKNFRVLQSEEPSSGDSEPETVSTVLWLGAYSMHTMQVHQGVESRAKITAF